MLPLTVFFLALSLAALAYRARSRWGYRPFFLGLPAAAMVIVGKFVFAVELVKRIACPSCEITVLDMKDAVVADRAKRLGIRSVPAVVVDGKPAECRIGRGPDEAALRAMGTAGALGEAVG